VNRDERKIVAHSHKKLQLPHIMLELVRAYFLVQELERLKRKGIHQSMYYHTNTPTTYVILCAVQSGRKQAPVS